MSLPYWTPQVGETVGLMRDGYPDDIYLTSVSRVRSPTHVDAIGSGTSHESYRFSCGEWTHTHWPWLRMVRLSAEHVARLKDEGRRMLETSKLRHLAAEALRSAPPEAVRECARILGLEVKS